MRPGRLADVFIVCVVLLLAAGVLARLVTAPARGASLPEVIGDSIVGLMGAVLFLALFYGFSTASIKAESRRSKDFFSELIEAHHVEELATETEFHGA